MVHPEGIEPSTSWAVTKHSIRLSYGCILEAPTGFEPVIVVLQTSALAVWPWRQKLSLSILYLYNNEYMTYYSLLAIVIVLFVSVEIYLLGKYLSKTSNIFSFNEPAIIMMGAVLYFVVTFFVFFIFIWINPSILYFVFIFLIKESIQVMFLILRREVFVGMKINWKAVGFTALAMIIFPIAYNLGLTNVLGLTHVKQVNDFQTWNLYGDVVAKFSGINREHVSSWVLGSISTAIIYNAVSSFVIAFSKKKNITDYIISLFAAFGLTLLFNFGQKLEDLSGIFLLLFAVQLSINIIIKSRRRYAVILGLLDLSLWFFQPELFLAIIVLSIIVIFLYTYLGKNKASLFVVQLISPILLISALWLYSVTATGALFLVALSISLYLFMISIGRLEALDKLNGYLIKLRIILPTIFIAGVTVAGAILFSTRDISMKDTWLFDDPIFDSFNNNVWNEFQKYSFYPVVALLVGLSLRLLLGNKSIIGLRLALILTTIILFLTYTAFMNIVTMNTAVDGQFKFIRVITIMPLTLIGIMSIRIRKYKGDKYVKSN